MTHKWQVILSRQAAKDAKKLAAAGMKPKSMELLDIIVDNPFQNPPPYEKLGGDMDGYFSRRINLQHRLVYQVLKKERIVRIIRMWTHYE